MEKKEELKNQHSVCDKWYSWDSPIGLGVFLILLALAFLITVSAVNGLLNAGQKGIMIEKQMKYMPR